MDDEEIPLDGKQPVYNAEEYRRRRMEYLIDVMHQYYGVGPSPEQCQHFMKYGTFGTGAVALPPEPKRKPGRK